MNRNSFLKRQILFRAALNLRSPCRTLLGQLEEPLFRSGEPQEQFGSRFVAGRHRVAADTEAATDNSFPGRGLGLGNRMIEDIHRIARR